MSGLSLPLPCWSRYAFSADVILCFSLLSSVLSLRLHSPLRMGPQGEDLSADGGENQFPYSVTKRMEEGHDPWSLCPSAMSNVDCFYEYLRVYARLRREGATAPNTSVRNIGKRHSGRSKSARYTGSLKLWFRLQSGSSSPAENHGQDTTGRSIATARGQEQTSNNAGSVILGQGESSWLAGKKQNGGRSLVPRGLWGNFKQSEDSTFEDGDVELQQQRQGQSWIVPSDTRITGDAQESGSKRYAQHLQPSGATEGGFVTVLLRKYLPDGEGWFVPKGSRKNTILWTNHKIGQSAGANWLGDRARVSGEESQVPIVSRNADADAQSILEGETTKRNLDNRRWTFSRSIYNDSRSSEQAASSGNRQNSQWGDDSDSGIYDILGHMGTN